MSLGGARHEALASGMPLRVAGVLLCAFGVMAAGRAEVGSPPAPDACEPGQVVDAEFRDAALRTFESLMLQAPGEPADGAVKAHPSPGYVDPQGQAWHYVSAYQVNLAFIGALRIEPALAPAAARWLRWQVSHTTVTGPGRGVVFDHWVRGADLREATCPPGRDARTCPQVDADDSTAASTLLMAEAYLRFSGDTGLLREPAVRAALESAAGTMASLAEPGGLSWAKPDHQVAYLMDAVEVAAGWRAWAHLQTEVYQVPQAGLNSTATAARLDAAIVKQLWHAPSQTWRVSLGATKPDFSTWYPDTVAQAWPLLWGRDAGPAALQRSRAAWRKAAAQWRNKADWSARNVDPDGFWWPAVAVAARCVGEIDSTRAWVARARLAWMPPARPFAWPFQVGDLLWLFWLADPVRSPIASDAPGLPGPPGR
ncbi:hypothetical protein RD110_08235 [Rhodoferax koreense]|uniref:Cellulase n=1 Tax=Rhodoferax koreensis TaxID=1842727 RepID=A0A1P8JTY6_9BURK|nr:hypothetical protein [Rhodoferax koreense]APW37188.1 hypothetical protein RD110_08235 [Rhodoferax koreense]